MVNDSARPIVFLHLPKTAGQSVRLFLNRAFPKRLVFPGQTDGHLAMHSRSDLRQYSIFAGHFSWSLLDFLGSEAMVFTILRDPALRIISFYRYLRTQAEALSSEQLKLPHNQGLRAAIDNPFEKFLTLNLPGISQFILSYFDNYYMFYFATRVVNGRSFIRDQHPESDMFASEQVLQVAIRNMRDALRAYNIRRLDDLVRDLSLEEGFVDVSMPSINRSADAASTREDILPKISDNLQLAKEQLYMRSQFDAKIYHIFG